jgi:hypothetical protein
LVDLQISQGKTGVERERGWHVDDFAITDRQLAVAVQDGITNTMGVPPALPGRQ